MTFPEEELPKVAEASLEVVRKAQDAGVWVFGGGLERQQASVVATDGTVTNGPYPETKAVLGGFSMIGFLRGYFALQGGEEADSCGAGQGAEFRLRGERPCCDPQI
ncbi:hypothetical protein ABT115_02140 [Streptomyces sp. NPDC001832]|uniref:YciI family protein n=1 Tax=Streptomyces sp. NPDC001832 TaxID=3154527 RepID=UPI00331A552C